MKAAAIRRARAGDAAGILALEELFPSDRMSARSARRFLRSASAGVWVAAASDTVAAALVLLMRRRARGARIYSLAVDPSARGQGLAKKLVRRAEAEARKRGFEHVSLEVRAGNTAARALYAGLGYTRAARLPRYYDDGAPGLRLRRTLAGRR